MLNYVKKPLYKDFRNIIKNIKGEKEMNIKEMFQNINKKNVAIIAAVLFAVVICSVCGFEYAQIQKARKCRKTEC